MLGIFRSRLANGTYRFARALSSKTLSQSISQPSFSCVRGSFSMPILQTQQLTFQHYQLRSYAHEPSANLTEARVTERVMTVIKLFEKINADKLTMESHFMKEMGLDSLDHVELIMAVEDEFGFEIPDQEAEKLTRPVDVIKFLCQKLQVATH